MDIADNSVVASSERTPVMAEGLEELVEPLDPGESRRPLAPGEPLEPEDEEPFRVVRLIKDGFPRRLYEVVQGEDAESLWLWEHAGKGSDAWEREVMLLRSALCPMFPRFQASFTAGENVYLATGGCDGETLADLLSRDPLDFARVVSILCQIAHALAKLHAAGFVHLGLRPEVIVAGRPAKVVDFGDATRIGEASARSFYHAGYSPPELLKGEPADVRSDIYAVGAMLFHAVGGRPIAETGVELTAWAPERPVAGAPQILARCLGAKETRYASAVELQRELVRLAKRMAPPARHAVGAATTIGLEPSRTTNQDAFTYCLGSVVGEEECQNWLMACVADGMGGMEAGDVASAAVVQSVEAQARESFAARSLSAAQSQAAEVKKWIHGANERVVAALEKRRAKGGSTVACVCLVGNRLALAHVGDCRIYLLRHGEARLLTRDHSLAMAKAAQGEIDVRDVRKHPERSAVTRSLGDRRPMPEYLVDGLEQTLGSSTMELEPGDAVLICSDGVWEPLDERELIAIAATAGPDLYAVADAMVEATLARGGGDNATAVLVRLV